MYFEIDNESFHKFSKETYNLIKDNPCIPDDIKKSWLGACVEFSDVDKLTNY